MSGIPSRADFYNNFGKYGPVATWGLLWRDDWLWFALLETAKQRLARIGVGWCLKAQQVVRRLTMLLPVQWTSPFTECGEAYGCFRIYPLVRRLHTYCPCLSFVTFSCLYFVENRDCCTTSVCLYLLQYELILMLNTTPVKLFGTAGHRLTLLHPETFSLVYERSAPLPSTTYVPLLSKWNSGLECSKDYDDGSNESHWFLQHKLWRILKSEFVTSITFNDYKLGTSFVVLFFWPDRSQLPKSLHFQGNLWILAPEAVLAVLNIFLENQL